MKKFFEIMGMLFTLLLVAGGLFFGYAIWDGKHNDQTSKAFVDTNMPKIAANWDPAVFQPLVDKDRMKTSDAQISGMMDIMKKHLGALKHYQEAKGQANIEFLLNGPSIVTAKYLVAFDSAGGPVEVKISLLKESGDWKIIGFYIDSPALHNVNTGAAAPSK